MLAIIEPHSGETVKLDAGTRPGPPARIRLFDTEEEAQAYAPGRFDETDGREYLVVNVQDIP